MRCLSPRTVAYQADGSLAWSQKTWHPESIPFKLPCGKCIECRLEYARSWAVRCVHEAKMYGDNNSFITLTYADEHLKSPKLDYSDFQKFMKRLRKTQNEPIGMFVTGEYGEPPTILSHGYRTEGYRPHWHLLVFNWRPRDLIYKRSNENGDELYSSALLDAIWGKGITETGQVTFKSAGYCARYAAKKLVHGKDQEHEFHPISKKSSKHAIGKKYLERYWQSIFNIGKIILDGGQETTIPRYYEKWLKTHHPESYAEYLDQIKLPKTKKAADAADKEQQCVNATNDLRRPGKGGQISKSKVLKTIIDQKYKLLQRGPLKC